VRKLITERKRENLRVKRKKIECKNGGLRKGQGSTVKRAQKTVKRYGTANEEAQNVLPR